MDTGNWDTSAVLVATSTERPSSSATMRPKIPIKSDKNKATAAEYPELLKCFIFYLVCGELINGIRLSCIHA
jgi:hypothetical protein